MKLDEELALEWLESDAEESEAELELDELLIKADANGKEYPRSDRIPSEPLDSSRQSLTG